MFLPHFSALNPWGIALVNASGPIKSYFVCCFLMGLMGTSPIGFQNKVFGILSLG